MAPKKQTSAGCTNTTRDDENVVGSSVGCKTSTRESSKDRDSQSGKESDVTPKGEDKKSRVADDTKPNGNVNKSKKDSTPDYASLYKQILSNSPGKRKSEGGESSKKKFSSSYGKKPCKVNTVGTHDGTIMAFASFASYNGCAYTTPIYLQLQADAKLRSMTKVTHLANRRSESPYIHWAQDIVGQQGSFKKKWHMYLRKLKNPEDNTEKLRKEWGTSLAAFFTSFGRRFEFPVEFEYAGDLKMTHMIDYLTVEDVFVQIEDVFVPASFNQEEMQKKREWIRSNNNLLRVYFGNSSDFLFQVRMYYRNTRRLPILQEPEEEDQNKDVPGEKKETGGDESKEDDMYALAERLF
jgi:hypothetical protein